MLREMRSGCRTDTIPAHRAGLFSGMYVGMHVCMLGIKNIDNRSPCRNTNALHTNTNLLSDIAVCILWRCVKFLFGILNSVLTRYSFPTHYIVQKFCLRMRVFWSSEYGLWISFTVPGRLVGVTYHNEEWKQIENARDSLFFWFCSL